MVILILSRPYFVLDIVPATCAVWGKFFILWHTGGSRIISILQIWRRPRDLYEPVKVEPCLFFLWLWPPSKMVWVGPSVAFLMLVNLCVFHLGRPCALHVVMDHLCNTELTLVKAYLMGKAVIPPAQEPKAGWLQVWSCLGYRMSLRLTRAMEELS